MMIKARKFAGPMNTVAVKTAVPTAATEVRYRPHNTYAWTYPAYSYWAYPTYNHWAYPTYWGYPGYYYTYY
jgi:hypothetical protein